MKNSPADVARMICHDVGEALLKRYGEFRGTQPQAVAEYYGLIREVTEKILQDQMTPTPKAQMELPVTYELDENGEATGIVHFFCSEMHRVHSWDSFGDPTRRAYGMSTAPEGTVCESCGHPLE